MMEGPFVMSTGPAVGLKRKSMSLNGDVLKEAHSGLVDVNLFSRDSYSREERRELRKKLRMHLEQLQGVTFKILARQEELTKVSCVVYPETQLSRTQNGGPLQKEIKLVPATMLDEPHRLHTQREARLARQPSVVVTSEGTPDAGSKDKRTPKANQLYMNSEFVSGKDKMPAAEKPKGKAGVGTKRVGAVKVEACNTKKQKMEPGRGKQTADIMKLCAALARKLCNHKHSWVFNEPVDAVKLGLHDYHQVIKKPMDLGTIKKKVNRGEYNSPLEFADDVRLTFSNAMTYNPQGHFVFAMAEQLRDLFEERWKVILEKIAEDEHKARLRPSQELLTPKPPVDEQSHAEEPEEAKAPEKVEVQVVTKVRPNGGKQAAQPKPKPTDLDKRLMTMDEKRKLSVSLENLHPDKLERIVQIIKKKKPTLSHNDDEIEIDIDSLDNDTLWELERFVSNCMKSRGKVKKATMSQLVKSASSAVPPPRARQLPPVIEVITENPPKPSSAACAEDVDVPGEAAAVAAPTGEAVEKEPGPGPVASSSSGSSSSDSGSASSSSDSDSASSSGSESEAEDVPRPPSAPKDVEAITREVAETVAEPVPAKLPVATQQDSRESQESQPERQVSPDKLLRAALLRGRFADTILKAHEKTLPQNKNEKLDPEKVKRDREELEKRQKEEKARLHAEAKAAEAARRKAEVEAAHEAKRKREAEREAARLQLQQMEKTVEIDENSEILKDLEMLRTASMDHLPSSGEDSPDSDSPDGLPDFALQGGNPLERLGLFMKNDEEDEDEDEEENNSATQANARKVAVESGGDVEEGEID